MINAWMPGEAKYVTCWVELAWSGKPDIFKTVLEQVTHELGGAPDEWRWELDDGVVKLTAAKALS